MNKGILFASGIIILMFFSLFMINVILPDEGLAGRLECSICGMWIDQYERTHHVVIMNDGKIKHFCSFACTAKGIEGHEDGIKTIKTADFPTKRLIDANKAYYLEGSDIPAVMSHISRIAFASEDIARKNQEQYGGRIVTFRQALNEEYSSSDIKNPLGPVL
jgi:nitrous oxide reductase accessory protein NosL